MMDTNSGTVLAHIAIIIVAFCNMATAVCGLIVSLRNGRRLRRIEQNGHGKAEGGEAERE